MTGQPPGAIAFLGLGLIGGSIAKALAAGRDPVAGAWPQIRAWSPDGRGPAAARREGVIDIQASSLTEALDGADLIVIAAPPLATIELIGRLGPEMRSVLDPDALVTDVASTKGAVMRAAAAADLRFVGGHPMAGREEAGYGASDAGLFRDRPWVVVSAAAAEPGLAERVHWLATACGARPLDVDAATHDAAVAAISHVPLVVSAALAEAVSHSAHVDWPLARSLAASGWESMTRLARGDARMGAGIAATNAPAIVAGLRAFRAVLDDWVRDLEAETPDVAELERRLASVRTRLLDPGTDA